MTPRLLMIEDDRRLAQMVAEYLGQSGFEVAHAPDGEQGLEQLRLLQPQMVILDLMMPGIDGLEVCRRIRALPDELARTPVLSTFGSKLRPVQASPPCSVMDKSPISRVLRSFGHSTEGSVSLSPASPSTSCIVH